MEQNIRVARLISIAMPALSLLTNLGLVAIIWWGGLQVVGGRLSLGELIAFNNYLITGMTPLLLLGNMLTMVSRAEASAARILEVMDTKPLIQTAAKPHTAETVTGRVVFDQVSFGYNNGDQIGPNYQNEDSLYDAAETINWAANGGGNGTGREAVLDGVSFVAEPGQRIALLGATGSGKTTLINLIPRFYDVSGGRVLVDGVDVRDWLPARLRGRVGMVLQQTTLFSGTIRENIAYGRPEVGLDEVIEAAKAAQAHDFIMAMPQAYDSMVEARGVNLSGGQRQRVAIARALLISPSILIFDDCTSAVDLETEIRIQAALDRLMVGRTTFIIAQRINSVLTADQILVLDSGRIVAQGTHRELLQSSPIYQEIYHSQLGDDDLNGRHATTQQFYTESER
jgi:ATP-binding cassette subfamily B protein